MHTLNKILPGLALALGVAGLGILVSTCSFAQHLGLSALTIAIVGGMILGNTLYEQVQAPCTPGINLSKQTLLRWGIILFGFKLTFQDIAQVGITGVMIDTLVLSSTFLIACFIGRRLLGLDTQSAILIGAGSAICGAAAVLATEPVLDAPSERVAVAVATVVVFGTLSMFLYPIAYHLLIAKGLWTYGDFAYGIFTGSTIHEVAQVAAAGRAVSEKAMDAAVITKMIRVMMLAPFLILLSTWWAYRGKKLSHNAASTSETVQENQTNTSTGKIVIPWFAVGFLVVIGFNSLNWLPSGIHSFLLSVDNILLAMAMAALGLTTHLSAIRKAGARPLLLASMLFAWLIVGGSAINALVTLALR